MSRNTYKHTKIAGPFKSTLMGTGGFLMFLAGFGLWNDGVAVLLPALKIAAIGGVVLAIGALIPSKNQYTQR